MVSAFEEFTDRPIPTVGSDRTHTKFRDGTKKEVIASALQGQRRLQRRDVGAGKKQEFSKHTKGCGRRALWAQGPARTKAWLIPALRVAQQAWGTGFVLGVAQLAGTDHQGLCLREEQFGLSVQTTGNH